MIKIIWAVLAFMSLSSAVWALEGTAMLAGTAPDSKLAGVVKLTEAEGGIIVQADIANAPPGKHGFHIHEKGSCEDKGNAAGGHFNPDKVDHGFRPNDGHAKSHAGDMGNITISDDGKGSLKVFLEGITLKEGKYATEGRAIILHDKEDDFGQPTGNAGGRIGCGIIQQNP